MLEEMPWAEARPLEGVEHASGTFKTEAVGTRVWRHCVTHAQIRQWPQTIPGIWITDNIIINNKYYHDSNLKGQTGV